MAQKLNFAKRRHDGKPSLSVRDEAETRDGADQWLAKAAAQPVKPRGPSANRKKPKPQKRAKSMRVQLGDGPPCPRCLQITRAWKHAPDWTPPARQNYYEFWYQCMNDACLTNQIMPPEAFVRRRAA